MTYEGQVAGLQDEVPTARARSAGRAPDQVALADPARRAPPRDRRRPGASSPSWSSGTPAAPARSSRPPPTRWSPRSPPGSGLLVPTLFDHYRSFDAAPGVVLRAAGHPRAVGRRSATVHGGGLVASGPAGPDRLPDPVGAGRAAADRARGRRRGADAAHRPRRGAARDRRPGVVPARQVRRALRARRRRAPALRRRVRRGRVPTYRGCGPSF